MSIREEQCNKVCRILDDVLANRPTERDSLIVAVRKAFEALEVFGNSEQLSSAQSEIKPIDYQDCANAMLRMWMDKVVTDGEYNRIMDKLNAFWGTRNERSD